MINNIIILVIMTIAVVQYRKQKMSWLLVTMGAAYVCMPVIKYGVDSGINSAYVITLVSFLMLVDSFFKGKLRFGKKQCRYLISMIVGVGFVFVGWIVNGNLLLSGIIHFAGMLQYILGVFIFSVFINSYAINKNQLFKRMFTIVIVLNYCIGVLQLFYWKVGEVVTRQLYVYAGKNIPLDDTFLKSGRFIRIFGTFYSPTVLGIVSLLIATFFLQEVLKQKKLFTRDTILYMSSIGLGLLAFSKIAIIGSFLILIVTVFVEIVQGCAKGKIGAYFRTLAIVASTYICIASLQCVVGFGVYVNYYYVQNFNVFVALETRYGNIFSGLNENEEIKDTMDAEVIETVISAETVESSASTETVEDSASTEDNVQREGNMGGAFGVFVKHPIIGVGPLPVEGEFMGDSEYISILHDGGILRFLTYGYFYCGLALYYFFRKCNHELIMLVGIGMGAVSMMVFSYGCIIPFMAYCICEQEK